VYDDAVVVGLDDGGRFRDVFAMMKKLAEPIQMYEFHNIQNQIHN
jgi:hypothetical protein